MNRPSRTGAAADERRPTPDSSQDAPLSRAPSPAFDLARVRSEIPLLERLIPMNACSQAPQTRATRRAAERYLDSWNRDGMDWETWIEEVERARAAFARLIGAHPAHVAVGSSVSQLTSSLASALDFEARPGVVTTDADFPTVSQVWEAQARRGARVVRVPSDHGIVDPDRIFDTLDDSVAVLSLSHGLYESGFIQDVAALGAAARAVGALTYIDAYQTLGTRPVIVDALDPDVLVGGCLKYLMGMPGLAFMYVRPELADRCEPLITGWFGREHPFAFTPDLDWAQGARRFDTGTPPVLEAYVCRAGLELVLDVGTDLIADWTRALSRRLIEGGRDRGHAVWGPEAPEHRTPLTAFRVEDGHAVESAMRERGVVASARGPVLRLAPHFYSSFEDVDAALDALTEVLQS